ncbi:MAG: hypothetical protein ACLUKN_05465 [Bacilli bacterium]
MPETHQVWIDIEFRADEARAGPSEILSFTDTVVRKLSSSRHCQGV